MPAMSKQKTNRIECSGFPTNGRLFCVTGMEKTSVTGEAVETNGLINQSDNETNTSGYLSSSLESSGEYFLNENDHFNMKADLYGCIPNTSTPKQDSLSTVSHREFFKRVINKRERSLLSIKKKHSTESVPAQTDSFWDIQTPRKPFRSNSQTDLNRKDRRRFDLRKNSFHTVSSNDIREVAESRKLGSQDWRRRPFLTQSDCYLDSLTKKSEYTNDKSTKRITTSQCFGAVPKSRVKGDKAPVVTKNKLTAALDVRKSVDDSMCEFLTNVNSDNFASFLMFYDKVTYSARHQSDHDAVYF